MESVHVGVAIVGALALLAFGVKHLAGKKRGDRGRHPQHPDA